MLNTNTNNNIRINGSDFIIEYTTSGKWMAMYLYPTSAIYLGEFDTADDAIKMCVKVAQERS